MCKDLRLNQPFYYRPIVLYTNESFGMFAHMVCQTSFGQSKNAKYTDLIKCMQSVRDDFIENNMEYFEIYAPKFGAGLCGLQWLFIEELIGEIWLDSKIPVTIVEYK